VKKMNLIFICGSVLVKSGIVKARLTPKLGS